MGIIFGSARIDENGNIVGGAAGDQTGTEVSTHPYYMHSKGWYALRPKDASVADRIAIAMQQACDNSCIGYDQDQRNTVITQLKKYGTLAAIATNCEADCSSLVRACIYQATGKDVGDMTTGNLASVLEKSGLFNARFCVTSENQLYNGDVLVTRTKYHTVIVVSGRPRSSSSGSTSSTWKATGTATCADDNVNVRSGAGTNYASYGKLGKGNRFEVDGKVSGVWVHIKVKLNGSDVIGYMHKDYVRYDSAPSSSTSVETENAASFNATLAGTYKVVNTDGEGLSMRAGAGTDKQQIAVVPEGEKVRNYGYFTFAGGFKWLYVTYGNKTGFVCDGGYLKKM